MIKNRDKIIARLNHIKLYGIPYIKCGNALSALFTTHNEISYIDLKKIISYRKSMREYSKISENNGNILFLFTNEYTMRKEYIKWFTSVLNLAKSKIVIKPCDKVNKYKKKYRFIYFIVWFFQIIGLQIPFLYKLACCVEILSGVENMENIIDIVKEDICRIKLVVTFCDIFTTDSMLIQYMNNNNIDTATLQHGQMGESWYFKYSESKKFLCFGKITQYFARKCNVNADKMIPLGMITCIHKNIVENINNINNSIFAVILESKESAGNDNNLLIEICNQFAKKYKYKYVLRPHPNDNAINYSKIIDKEVFAGYSYKNISVEKLTEQIQFAITGNTSVYAELVYLLVPVFRYVFIEDMYRGIKWGIFKNLYELENMYFDYIGDIKNYENYLKKVRKYICQDNIKENYMNYFKRYEL